MPNDPLAGLFKRGLKIDLPGGERERHARRLAQLGLIHLDKLQWVKCVNPCDHDQELLKDRDCPGRVYFDSDLDEQDDELQCSDCGRLIEPRHKHQVSCIRIEPNDSAVTAAVIAQIRSAGFAPDERPRGLFRIASGNGLAEVCLVDYCPEPTVLMEGYARQVLFVIANDRDLLFRFAGRADVFRLIDLVLGEAGLRHPPKT